MMEANSLRKGIRIIGFLAFLLIAAACGYIAGMSVGRSTVPELMVEAEPAESVEAFREKRRQERQEQIAQLNGIVQNPDTNSEIEFLAQQKLIELMNSSEKETLLEGMLSLRGFDAPLVVVHSDSAHVFVRNEMLTERQAAIILECVTGEIQISAGNVKIIPIK